MPKHRTPLPQLTAESLYVQAILAETNVEHLLNDPLMNTPADIGTPTQRDGNPYPGELGKPHDLRDNLEELCPEDEDDEEDEADDGIEEELEEEDDDEGGPSGYGAVASGDPSGPSRQFIERRGLPDGDDGVAWDDTSRPVQKPGPDPHFQKQNSKRRQKMITAAKLRAEQEVSFYNQWAVEGGLFFPTGPTVAHLPPGPYDMGATWDGRVYLSSKEISYDDLLVLPDSPTQQILAVINKFWSSQDRYIAHGLVHKRAALLWGPPGGGKTCAIHQAGAQIVAQGGIVVYCQRDPGLLAVILKTIRNTEPTRPIICVAEDLERMVSYDESTLLALLDGEHQVSNVYVIATSNYPEHLPARLINRPSRFDAVIKVGMPSANDRRTYFQHKTNNGLSVDQLRQWVADTEDMSIAHLRELVVAVYCLEESYDETISRLKGMGTRPTSHGGMDGFREY